MRHFQYPDPAKCRTAGDVWAAAKQNALWRETMKPRPRPVLLQAPALPPPSPPPPAPPPAPPRSGSVAEVIAITAAYFNMRPYDIVGPGKEDWQVVPRQVAMYVAHRKGDLSFPVIGRAFGRDHTTVLANARKIELKLEAGDVNLKAAIDEIAAMVERHEIPVLVQTPSKRGRSYSKEDEETLTRMYLVERRPIWEIARKVNRVPKSVRAKIRDLGLRRPRKEAA